MFTTVSASQAAKSVRIHRMPTVHDPVGPYHSHPNFTIRKPRHRPGQQSLWAFNCRKWRSGLNREPGITHGIACFITGSFVSGCLPCVLVSVPCIALGITERVREIFVPVLPVEVHHFCCTCNPVSCHQRLVFLIHQVLKGLHTGYCLVPAVSCIQSVKLD